MMGNNLIKLWGYNSNLYIIIFKITLDKFSDEEKQKLADMQEQFKAAQKEEPANLREHLPAFNDRIRLTNKD